MGHKVNPVGLRVGINRTWDSRWFAGRAEYGRLLHEDRAIRGEILKQQRQAGIPAYLSPTRRIRESLERLVQLYDAWGKPSQAAEWRQKIGEFKRATPGGDGNIPDAHNP